jgi:hypothetical protein
MLLHVKNQFLQLHIIQDKQAGGDYWRVPGRLCCMLRVKNETPSVIGHVVIYHSADTVASMHVSLVRCVHSASTHLKQTFFYQHMVLQTTHNV